jgi:hypothetical protein
MRPSNEGTVYHATPQPPAGPAGRRLARVAGIALCAVAAAALVVLLFIGIADRVWRLAALLGAAAAVAGVVVLLPASLRARARLLAAAFLAAIGVLPLVVTADNGPAPPPPPSAKPVNADYLANLIEKGPFTERLPAPLVAGNLVKVPISGPGAATKVSGVQLQFSVPGNASMGGGAFIETYRSIDEAAARVAARLEELRTVEAPLEADEGDATRGYCVSGKGEYWTCGAHHGNVFVEVVLFPPSNAGRALATEALTTVLRYTDRMTVLASA